MKEIITLSGVVLFSAPVSENDRRMVILSRERGKITVFANGCRKMNSRITAFTRPFTFARFNLYPGKDSYHLESAEMIESFEEITGDFDALTLGTYFLELAGYFSEENVEAQAEVDLIYLSIKALLKKNQSNRLIRAIFELKILSIQGIAPQVFECVMCGEKIKNGYLLASKHGIACKKCVPDNSNLVYLNETATYAIQFVETTDIRKIYSFTLEQSITEAFCDAMKHYYKHHVNKHFKSLDMLID